MKPVDLVRCGLTLISPALNTRFNYLLHFRRRICLRTPQTLEEKLLWLKLNRYIGDPLVIQCADKLRVREYVASQGCDDTLNRLIAVYDRPEEINWDMLPDRFVLKWNFGCGYNVICRDKRALDVDDVIAQFRKWGKERCWLPFSEMQYRDTPHKIICEEYLEDSEHPDALPDFKVYCFHGDPVAIMVMYDRGKGIKREFFNRDWVRQPNPDGKPLPDYETPRPVCFELLKETSRKLSAPFPFVRCDFYIVSGKVIFGEMTFTPAGSIYTTHTAIDGKPMADYLHIPGGR